MKGRRGNGGLLLVIIIGAALVLVAFAFSVGMRVGEAEPRRDAGCWVEIEPPTPNMRCWKVRPPDVTVLVGGSTGCNIPASAVVCLPP